MTEMVKNNILAIIDDEANLARNYIQKLFAGARLITIRSNALCQVQLGNLTKEELDEVRQALNVAIKKLQG